MILVRDILKNVYNIKRGNVKLNKTYQYFKGTVMAFCSVSFPTTIWGSLLLIWRQNINVFKIHVESKTYSILRGDITNKAEDSRFRSIIY